MDRCEWAMAQLKKNTYSELRKNERRPLKDAVPLDRPYILYIEPSSICNFKCVQCPQSLQDHEKLSGRMQNMTVECFHKIINDVAKWRESLSIHNEPFFRVVKTYLFGEPLVSPDYCEMVRLLKEQGISQRIELTTNGSLLTEKISEKLVMNKLDYLRVSVYSVEETKNKLITQSSFTPDQIKLNILRLKDIKNQSFSSTPYILAQMIDTYSEENNLFRDFYQDVVDEIAFETPMNWTGEADFIGRMFEGKSQDAIEVLNSHKNRRVCHSPFHSLAVRSNGDVISCCRDWQGKTKIGNIFEESLMEIWNGSAMKSFRHMHLSGERNTNSSCAPCTWPNTMPEEDSLDELTIDEFNSRIIKR
jgi:radical SAM protein with 4Fe4S-binding SPASM domain